MYRKFIRPFLFLFDPESVHHFTFSTIRLALRIPLAAWIAGKIFKRVNPRFERTIFGLKFSNPVGLAAGFDKDALLVDELQQFGFGFIEIGTVTPKPQPGNPKPRLFRLPKDSALINRMGFNNQGAEAAAARLKKRSSHIIIGGNIGKNKDTPNELAVEDYKKCMLALADVVDYFVVNVSSPNTPGLRELQVKEPLKNLLLSLKEYSEKSNWKKPILLKIAPDLNQHQLMDVITILKETNLDGVIATNTTISRDGLRTQQNDVAKIGVGGLSGKPLSNRSTEIIRILREKLGPDFPIIGVGGIMTPQDAVEKLNAGANLIQLYTGFIYEGPGIVKRILSKLH
ncbi:MAG: quinone-dependent dihydroorotate dehydrogenase [Bacteroidetes bacterium]|nr:quinone-dependent dihydroorotate dehydrogenase [Bacteroidota bacterium]